MQKWLLSTPITAILSSKLLTIKHLKQLKTSWTTAAKVFTQAPHSATAQFFINVVDNDFLNFSGESLQGWGYCVFAEVVEGMDVVDKIKGVATGRSGMHQDVPKEDVIIESVTVSE